MTTPALPSEPMDPLQEKLSWWRRLVQKWNEIKAKYFTLPPMTMITEDGRTVSVPVRISWNPLADPIQVYEVPAAVHTRTIIV